MASVVKRGKAVVEGIPGTLDVVTYPIKQTGRMGQQWNEEIIADEHGFDAAWLARNEHQTFDIAMKLLGDTQAHAIAGGAFLAPLATVTLTGFDLAIMNGDYQYVGGAEIDLGNTKVGDFSIKLRKYADSTQNTAATTTPS